MSKAEKFIQEHTRNCSNELDAEYTEDAVYIPWLTPDQARRAVEIEREETLQEIRTKLLYMLNTSIDNYIEKLKAKL